MNIYRLGPGLEHIWIAAGSIEEACKVLGGRITSTPKLMYKHHLILPINSLINHGDGNYSFSAGKSPYNDIYIPLSYIMGEKTGKPWAKIPIEEILEPSVNIGRNF